VLQLVKDGHLSLESSSNSKQQQQQDEAPAQRQ
jgi:hypothetical protein